MYRDHSITACSRHIEMGVILRAHRVRGDELFEKEIDLIFSANSSYRTRDTSSIFVGSAKSIR